MKTFIALVFCFAGLAFADHHGEDGKGKMFEERKAMVLKNVQTRIDSLMKKKDCMTAATEKSAMKECRAAHKERVKSIKDEMKSMKAEMKAQRKARRGK